MWWMRGGPKRRFWTAMGQLPVSKSPGSAKHRLSSGRGGQAVRAPGTATGYPLSEKCHCERPRYHQMALHVKAINTQPESCVLLHSNFVAYRTSTVDWTLAAMLCGVLPIKNIRRTVHSSRPMNP